MARKKTGGRDPARSPHTPDRSPLASLGRRAPNSGNLPDARKIFLRLDISASSDTLLSSKQLALAASNTLSARATVEIGERISVTVLGRKQYVFVITKVEPVDAGATAGAAVGGSHGYAMTPQTQVTVSSCPAIEEHPDPPVLGGVKALFAKLCRVARAALACPEFFTRLGLEAPRGMILSGPAGVGKLTLARAVPARLRLPLFSLSTADARARNAPDLEALLDELFTAAQAAAPSVVVVQELDVLCPAHAPHAHAAGSQSQGASDETGQRLIQQLARLLDGVTPGQVLVIATTSRLAAVDTSLRTPGRLDHEYEIAAPDARARESILESLLSSPPPAPTPTRAPASASPLCVWQGAAVRTQGFVGADLAALCTEASVAALRRFLNAPEPPPELRIEARDLAAVMDRGAVRPSALREVSVEVPRVQWGEIGGLEGVKQRLREVVEWPIVHAEALQRMGVQAPHGVLLYGPPGCSKTMLARALATESSMNFIAVKGPELLSKWVGESERAVQEVFRKARAAAPCIVFFDEIDSLAGKRGEASHGAGDRVLSQLLTEMDGIASVSACPDPEAASPQHEIVVVAATNRPDQLDAAFLRPGRMDRIMYVGLPDLPARQEIFTGCLRKTPPAADVDVARLAASTDGYSGAELVAVCREAALQALRDSIDTTHVAPRHFDRALEIVTPRTSAELIAYYDKFRSIHSSLCA